MITYPHAKINIGLQVLNKRSDGFHDIETALYPMALCDILEIKPSDQTRLFLYGLTIEGALEDNLCMKAYSMLQADFDLPPVHLHLHKQIPVGAGLGGGSSNGAYTLRLLNEYFSLGIIDLKLEEYAARLGSDCPAMLYKHPSLATGRGEVLTPVELDLSGYYILICKPSIAVSTAQAYAKVHPQKPECPLREMLALPVKEWNGRIVNDFEAALFPDFPILQECKETLYRTGALYASLSGSGSALYGIYESKELYEQAHAFFTEHLVLE